VGDDDSQIWILSARYGLVNANDLIDSYEMKIDDPLAVTVGNVVGDVRSLGLDEVDTYVFAPRKYWEILWEAGEILYWTPQWINEADAGIGYQRGTAATVRKS
jgi:hypothetical protein